MQLLNIFLFNFVTEQVDEVSNTFDDILTIIKVDEMFQENIALKQKLNFVLSSYYELLNEYSHMCMFVFLFSISSIICLIFSNFRNKKNRDTEEIKI